MWRRLVPPQSGSDGALVSAQHARQSVPRHTAKRRSPLGGLLAPWRRPTGGRHAASGASRRRYRTHRRFWWRFPVVASVAGVLVIGLGAGSAFAYFASQGSSTVAVTIATMEPAVVKPATGSPGSELHPGYPADLSLTLTNPDDYQVIVTGVSQDGAISVTPPVGGCTSTSAGVSVSAAVASGLDYPLTPGTHTITVHTGAWMSTTSSGSCETASFHIPVDVTVQS